MALCQIVLMANQSHPKYLHYMAVQRKHRSRNLLRFPRGGRPCPDKEYIDVARKGRS